MRQHRYTKIVLHFHTSVEELNFKLAIGQFEITSNVLMNTHHNAIHNNCKIEKTSSTKSQFYPYLEYLNIVYFDNDELIILNKLPGSFLNVLLKRYMEANRKTIKPRTISIWIHEVFWISWRSFTSQTSPGQYLAFFP